MPKALQVKLSEEERHALEALRDKGPKAYLRERAAAILKIAQGLSASEVAERGLLKRRQYQTVCLWVHAYKQGGIAGLSICEGRGRKAAFFPPSTG